MFETRRSDEGTIEFIGRLDASQAEKARGVLAAVLETCTIDMGGLEYISSMGLSVLLETQKRLSEGGHGLRLVRLNKRIEDLFRVAGFDTIFEIEK